jgi:GNAT superfamily N-acetyltransferase
MITIEPATADRFDDVRMVMAPKSESTPACWCLAMRVSSGDPRIADHRNRPAVLKELCSADIPPGVLAYVDGDVAGWCSVSPRASYHRLAKSRVIPHVDDLPVWSVVCFLIRAPYRRQGLAGELLEGAVANARRHGATVVEGYPADTGGDRIDVSSAYVGSLTLFERHGFTKVSDTSSIGGGKPRVIVRRTVI